MLNFKSINISSIILKYWYIIVFSKNAPLPPQSSCVWKVVKTQCASPITRLIHGWVWSWSVVGSIWRRQVGEVEFWCNFSLTFSLPMCHEVNLFPPTCLSTIMFLPCASWAWMEPPKTTKPKEVFFLEIVYVIGSGRSLSRKRSQLALLVSCTSKPFRVLEERSQKALPMSMPTAPGLRIRTTPKPQTQSAGLEDRLSW